MTSETTIKNLLLHTLEEIETELGSDFPISSVILLLRLPTKGTMPMSQLVKQSRLSPAGVSRTVATLAGFGRANRRVMDNPMVVMTDDTVDRRYKMVGLSNYGVAFIARLASLYSRYVGA